MRTSSLVSLALASAALLFSFGAKAVPIHVGIEAAGGSHSWRSGPIQDPSYVNLSAWQFNGNTWDPAYMTNGEDGGNPGLGVCSVMPEGDGNVCLREDETNQIDSIPSQMIELGLNEFEDWNGVTITMLSVEDLSEVMFTGASCSMADVVAGDCQAQTTSLEISSTYCSRTLSDIWSCTYSRPFLADFFDGLGIKDIWIQPQGHCLELCTNANFYMASGEKYGLILNLVPEPSALGMFGLGTLLIGVFVGLRRRRRTS